MVKKVTVCECGSKVRKISGKPICLNASHAGQTKAKVKEARVAREKAAAMKIKKGTKK